MPMTAVIIAPVLKLIALGLTFEKSWAGGTMLAAMFVVSVATMRPAIEITIVRGPPTFVSSVIGSPMRCPKITTVAFVTAAPMNANNAIVAGRPIAWPTTWSFWLFAERRRAGIESAIVPPNAHPLVSPAALPVGMAGGP